MNDKKSNDTQKLAEKRISGETAYQGSFFQVQRDKVLLPDNKESTREYIRHPGAAVILPLLENGHVILERQFRYACNDIFIEVPAGKIDKGEAVLECAKRELKEETGYEAEEWRYLTTIHNALGYSNEHLEIFLARKLKKGEQKLDEGEFIDIFTMHYKELLDMVKQGKVTDVKTVIAAFWLEKICESKW